MFGFSIHGKDTLKKVTLALWFTVCAANVQCQSRLAFQAGIGKSESNKSLALYVEPICRLSKFQMGLRIETFRIKSERSVISFTANGIRYFQKTAGIFSKFQPFAGMGVGIFAASHQNDSFAYISPTGATYYARINGDSFHAIFGLYPRIGVSYKRFNVTFEYNLTYRKSLTVTYYDPVAQAELPPAQFYRSENYSTIKIGYRFFGKN